MEVSCFKLDSTSPHETDVTLVQILDKDTSTKTKS